MKHLKILGGLLIAYTLNSCSLFSEAEPTELPPATQTGANTFGCLVNGKLFVPKSGGNYEGITKNYDGGLGLAALYVKDKQVENGIGISTPLLNGVGKYLLEKPKSLWHNAFHDRNLAPLNASVTITKFERGEDKANNLRWLIISGTFEGVLLPESKYKDTIRITEGRFDVKFN